MDGMDILALGIRVTPPWRLVGQRPDTGKRPHVLGDRAGRHRPGRFVPLPGLRPSVQGQ